MVIALESTALQKTIDEMKSILPELLSSVKDDFYKEEEQCKTCSDYEAAMNFDDKRDMIPMSKLKENAAFSNYHKKVYSNVFSEGWCDSLSYCYCPDCHNLTLFYTFMEHDEDTDKNTLVGSASYGSKRDHILDFVFIDELLPLFAKNFIHNLSDEAVHVYCLVSYDSKPETNYKGESFDHYNVSFFSENELLAFVSSNKKINFSKYGIARTSILESDLYLPNMFFESGMSGFIDNSRIAIPSSKVKGFEFYNFKTCSRDTLDENDTDFSDFKPKNIDSETITTGNYLNPRIASSFLEILEECKTKKDLL